MKMFEKRLFSLALFEPARFCEPRVQVSRRATSPTLFLNIMWPGLDWASVLRNTVCILAVIWFSSWNTDYHPSIFVIAKSCLLTGPPSLLIPQGEGRTWETGSPGSDPTRQGISCPGALRVVKSRTWCLLYMQHKLCHWTMATPHMQWCKYGTNAVHDGYAFCVALWCMQRSARLAKSGWLLVFSGH